VCCKLLRSVRPEGGSANAICAAAPRTGTECYVAAALALLWGRGPRPKLLETLGALEPTDSSSKRRTVNKVVDKRLPELLELERRLTSLPAPTAQQYRTEAERELPPPDDDAHIGDGDGNGFSLAVLRREALASRAQRVPAVDILTHHPHLTSLVISIVDPSFTYFDWGEDMGEASGDEAAGGEAAGDEPTRYYGKIVQRCAGRPGWLVVNWAGGFDGGDSNDDDEIARLAAPEYALRIEWARSRDSLAYRDPELPEARRRRVAAEREARDAQHEAAAADRAAAAEAKPQLPT